MTRNKFIRRDIYTNITRFSLKIKLPKIKRRRTKEIRREVRSISCKLRCSGTIYEGDSRANKKVLQVLLSLPVIKRTTLRSFFSPEGSTINRHVSSFLNSPKSSGQRERRIFVPRKLLPVYFIPFNVQLLSRLSLIVSPNP